MNNDKESKDTNIKAPKSHHQYHNRSPNVSQRVAVTAQITVPPDGGWGWVVVVASFLIFAIGDGTVFTFGSIYNDLETDLDLTPAYVSLISSMTVSSSFICGPIVSAVINRYGFRTCAMVGSGITSMSCFLTFLFGNYISLLLFYGLIAGLGFSMLNMPALLAVGFYFLKLRGVAFPCAIAGSSIGIIVLALVYAHMAHVVGWRYTIMLQACLTGFTYFVAMAYRPLLSMSVVIATDEDEEGSESNGLLSTIELKTRHGFRRSSLDEDGLKAFRSNQNFPTAAEIIDNMSREASTASIGPSTPHRLSLIAMIPINKHAEYHEHELERVMSLLDEIEEENEEVEEYKEVKVDLLGERYKGESKHTAGQDDTEKKDGQDTKVDTFVEKDEGETKDNVRKDDNENKDGQEVKVDKYVEKDKGETKDTVIEDDDEKKDDQEVKVDKYVEKDKGETKDTMIEDDDEKKDDQEVKVDKYVEKNKIETKETPREDDDEKKDDQEAKVDKYVEKDKGETKDTVREDDDEKKDDQKAKADQKMEENIKTDDQKAKIETDSNANDDDHIRLSQNYKVEFRVKENSTEAPQTLDGRNSRDDSMVRISRRKSRRSSIVFNIPRNKSLQFDGRRSLKESAIQLDRRKSRTENASFIQGTKSILFDKSRRESLVKDIMHWEEHVPEARPMYRDDAFLDNTALNATHEEVAENPIEYQLRMSRVATREDLKERKGMFTTAFTRVLFTMLDPHLLKRKSCLCVCLSMFFFYSAFLVPIIFIADRGLAFGIPHEYTRWFLSAIGVAAFFGRFIGSAIALRAHPIHILCAMYSVAGLATILSIFCTSADLQFLYCVVYGITTCGTNSMRTVIFARLYGLENLTNCTGIAFLFQGVGCLLSPPIAGVLKGVWHQAHFIFSGFCFFCSAALFLPVFRLVEKEKRMIEQHKLNL